LVMAVTDLPTYVMPACYLDRTMHGLSHDMTEEIIATHNHHYTVNCLLHLVGRLLRRIIGTTIGSLTPPPAFVHGMTKESTATCYFHDTVHGLLRFILYGIFVCYFHFAMPGFLCVRVRVLPGEHGRTLLAENHEGTPAPPRVRLLSPRLPRSLPHPRAHMMLTCYPDLAMHRFSCVRVRHDPGQHGHTLPPRHHGDTPPPLRVRPPRPCTSSSTSSSTSSTASSDELVDMTGFRDDVTTRYHHDTAKADPRFFVYNPPHFLTHTCSTFPMGTNCTPRLAD
jgi:hypothetical protein